jgi:hypothetical protein
MTETEARAFLVQTARKYLGCRESDGSHRKIIDIYNGIRPLPRSFKMTYSLAWCATFVSAMAKLCGMLDIIPAECSCGHQVALFQKLGRWRENDNYKPAPGDIIYYYWSDSGEGDCTGWPDHVGIVESVTGGLITVIEGNSSNAVRERTRVVGARYIRGYGLPDFAAWAGQKETTPTPAPVAPAQNNTKEVPKMEMLRKGSKGYHVKVAQALLALNGYKCGSYGADGDFGGATEAATRAFQKAHGLNVDGIIGDRTWSKLLGI